MKLIIEVDRNDLKIGTKVFKKEFFFLNKKSILKMLEARKSDKPREKIIKPPKISEKRTKHIADIIKMVTETTKYSSAYAEISYEFLCEPEYFVFISALSNIPRTTIEISDKFRLKIVLKIRFFPLLKLLLLIIKTT